MFSNLDDPDPSNWRLNIPEDWVHHDLPDGSSRNHAAGSQIFPCDICPPVEPTWREIPGEPGHSWMPDAPGSPNQMRYGTRDGQTFCCALHSPDWQMYRRPNKLEALQDRIASGWENYKHEHDWLMDGWRAAPRQVLALILRRLDGIDLDAALAAGRMTEVDVAYLREQLGASYGRPGPVQRVWHRVTGRKALT